MTKTEKTEATKAKKLSGAGLPRARTPSRRAPRRAPAGRPDAFADSFTTADACFSVEVKDPWGEVTEDIEVKIDCGGMIHGDEDLIDVLIEMLEKAKENLAARRGKLTRRRLESP